MGNKQRLDKDWLAFKQIDFEALDWVSEFWKFEKALPKKDEIKELINGPNMNRINILLTKRNWSPLIYQQAQEVHFVNQDILSTFIS